MVRERGDWVVCCERGGRREVYWKIGWPTYTGEEAGLLAEGLIGLDVVDAMDADGVKSVAVRMGCDWTKSGE